VVLKLTQYHGDFQRLLQMDTFMQVSEWTEDLWAALHCR